MSKSKIEIANKTGIPELDAVIKAVSNNLGIDVSGKNYGNINTHTTGSLSWDIALRRGGLPLGRVIEIMGDESTLKTTFCVLALAARQKWRKEQGIEKRDLIIDLEHSLTEDFLIGYGVDLDQVIWQRFQTIEPALQCAIDLPRTGYIDYVILDSVDAGQNEKQVSRQIGENDVGGISKQMNDALRKIVKIGSETETTYMFINQVKMNPGVSFGNPRVTPGGRALQFYASLRIELLKRQQSKDMPNASVMRGKIVKTKMSADVKGEIQATVDHTCGYDEVYEVNQLATELGILRHSSGQTKVWWTPDSEGEPLTPDIEKGKEAGLQAIRDDAELRNKLKELVINTIEVQRTREFSQNDNSD